MVPVYEHRLRKYEEDKGIQTDRRKQKGRQKRKRMRDERSRRRWKKRITPYLLHNEKSVIYLRGDRM